MNTIHVIGPSIYFMYVRSFQELWYPSRTGLSPGESDWPKIVQLVGARPVWFWISCSLQLPWPDCLPRLLLGGARPVLPTGSGGEGSAWPGKQTKRPPGGCPVLPPHKPLRDSHSPGSHPVPHFPPPHFSPLKVTGAEVELAFDDPTETGAWISLYICMCICVEG